jgi:uncharacterized protein YbjT (DUF2867 family)
MRDDHSNAGHNEPVVLVLGATGQQGGAVARALTSMSRPVRIMVRDPDTPAAKIFAASGVEIVPGDFGDTSSIRNALSGVGGVFSVQPNSGSPGSGITDEDEVRYGKLVADLAVEANVSHFVYSSASIISRGPTGVANLDCKLEIEDYVRSLTIPTTIVRPATFMELFARTDFWPSRNEFSFFIDPDKRLELIASDDIGRVVAMIFDDRDRFAGKSINIAGDEMTGTEIASAFSSLMNVPIIYRCFSDEILNQQPALKKTVNLFNAGAASGNADRAAISKLFGPLSGLEEWLTSHSDMLRRAIESKP